MTTLFERLKPEIKEILYAEGRTYPITVKFIMKHLAQTSWVGDLKLSVVADIASVGGLKEHLALDYSDMYLVSYLDQMFEPIK